MVTLKINGKEVTVEEGTLILDAAKEAGVEVPTFCYQAELSSLGSCRMCLIEIEGQRKLQPACITPVLADMGVQTDNEKVSGARTAMLEFLLSNHAMDCPVCDKAGECELQDMVHKHGPRKGRHTEPKVKFHYKDYNLSPVIVKNSNRCVQCTRCVRVCDEVVGRSVLGSIGRGQHQEETSFLKKELDCDHCGMCIEVCPVGSFMRRPYRYKARPWDLKGAKTVCPYCATGCSVTVQERGGEAVRSIATRSGGFNNIMLCARGRFGYDIINSKDRLTEPMLKKDGEFVPISWDAAYSLLKEKLTATSPGRVGAIAGARLTNEELFIFQKLMRDGVGSGNIDSSSRWDADSSAAFAYGANLHKGGSNIYNAMESDLVFIAGSQLSDENPVTDYIVRNEAASKRKTVMIASSRAMKLDKSAALTIRHNPGRVGAIFKIISHTLYTLYAARLEAVNIMGVIERFDLRKIAMDAGVVEADIREVASRFAESKSVTLLVGTDMLRYKDGFSALVLLRRILDALDKKVRIIPLLDRSNQRGAWDMGVHPHFGPGYSKVGTKGLGTEEMLEAAKEGNLDTLYVVGEDIVDMYPDAKFAEDALSKVGFLAVQDAFLTDTAKMADLVLPTAVYAEKTGTITNQEGRVHTLLPALSAPESVKTDHEIFAMLGSSLMRDFGDMSVQAVYDSIKEGINSYSHIEVDFDVSDDKCHCRIVKSSGSNFDVDTDSMDERERDLSVREGEYVLLTGNHLLHSGRVSSNSKILTGLSSEASVELSAEDAEELNLSPGDKVNVSGNGYAATLAVRVKKGTMRGVAFIAENFTDVPVNRFYQRGKVLAGVKIKPVGA